MVNAFIPLLTQMQSHNVLIYEIVEEGYRHLDFITVLHAAALKWKGHCFVMPAKGGSGKTTLAAALMHQGAEYLADDVVPLLSKEGDICPLRNQSLPERA